jgi:hypothetical protein
MNNQNPRKPAQFSLWGALFFPAALVLLFSLLSHVGWADIGQALSRISLWQAAVILGFGFFESVFDAVALQIAMVPRPRLLRLLATNGVGSLANMLLPWDLGELTKVALLRNAATGTAAVAIWNLAFKLSRPLGAMLFVIISWFGIGTTSGTSILMITGITLLSFAPYLLLRWLLRRGAATTIVRLLSRFPWMRRFEARLFQRAEPFDREVKQVFDDKRRQYGLMVAAQIPARMGSGFAFCAVTWALEPDIPVTTMALLYAAMNVADLLTLALPARLGVAESAAFIVFPWLGLPAGLGAIVYLTLRIKAILTNGLVAPFALFMRR